MCTTPDAHPTSTPEAEFDQSKDLAPRHRDFERIHRVVEMWDKPGLDMPGPGVLQIEVGHRDQRTEPVARRTSGVTGLLVAAIHGLTRTRSSLEAC